MQPNERDQSDSWNKCHARGEEMNSLLAAGGISESEFMDYKKLDKYGWTALSTLPPIPDEIAATSSALEDIGLPQLTDKSWNIVHRRHNWGTMHRIRPWD